MPSIVQTSFARGELSSELFGRVDTAAYQIGLRVGWNIFIKSSGGASNRAGLEYIGPVKDHSRTVRLIPFRFKTTDTYMLEFGHEYMRVIRGDSHVVYNTTTITAITQANPAVVTAAGHGLANGEEFVISGVTGMTEVNGRRFVAQGVTVNTINLGDQLSGDPVDSTDYTAYSADGQIDQIFEIETPYQEADLDELDWVQSADVMTITHTGYEPRELSRTDHDAWTLDTIEFLPSQTHPTNVAAVQDGTTGSTTYRYKVTAIADETFEESLPGLSDDAAQPILAITQADPAVVTVDTHGRAEGEEIYLSGITGMTDLNGRHFRVANPDTNTFELKGEDSTDYAAYVSGGTVTSAFDAVTDGNASLSATDHIDITWTAAAGAQRYAVYKEENGLYGLLGETETLSFVDDGSNTPDLESSPPRPREPFRGSDNWPAAVGFYQQRRVFGGSTDNPDTNDFSRTGDFSNFTKAVPERADDAMRIALVSRQVNAIRHYLGTDDLLVFTSGAEWRIDAGDNNRFSTDTVRQQPQSDWGCSFRQPLRIGRVVLFVDELEQVVRSIGYELAVDGYTGTDMTLLAAHIFRDETISEWDYAKGSDTIVYVVRSDGQAMAFTFNPEQEVIAWTRWGTRFPDKFETCAVVRPSATDKDELPYFVVKRQIDGNTVRYIERLHDRRFAEDVQDAVFVDSNLTFDSPISVTDIETANPLVITLETGHGLVAGDKVDVSDIVWEPDTDEFCNETQPNQLNGGRYTINSVSGDEITLSFGGETWDEVSMYDLDDLGDIGGGSDLISIGQPSIAVLSSTRIAIIDHGNGQLVALDYDASAGTWSQVGNKLDYPTAVSFPMITALSSTRIAAHHRSDDLLRTFDFDGTDWTQTGNSFSLTTSSQRNGMVALNATRLAFFNATDDSLQTYDFDESDWAATGDPATITGADVPAVVAGLSSDRVAVYDGGTEELSTYEFNGTDWNQIGNSLTVSNDARNDITALDDEVIVLYDSVNDLLQAYRFDGTDWAAYAAPSEAFPINESQLDIAALSSTRIVYVGSTEGKLHVIDFNGAASDASDFNAYVEGGFVRKRVGTFTGLHHLRNETISVLANGDPIHGLTVSATGSVTLPNDELASRVHFGFRYYSDVHLLGIAVPGAASIEGRNKNVGQVVVRLDRSVGLLAGPDSENLVEVPFRHEELYDVPTQLFSGDVEIDVLPSWDQNGSVLFRQCEPLPMTILAAVPRFETEDDDEG